MQLCVVLQFRIKIAHIVGSIKTAANFFSRLELRVSKQIRLKIREDMRTRRIEVTTSSSDVGDRKQFFFTQEDNEKESEEPNFETKEQSWQVAKNG